MIRSLAGLAGALGLLICGAAAAAPLVATPDGRLRGSAKDGVETFLGAPYAAPPVGALRWAPPSAATPWAGVRDATQPGHRCPQTATGPIPRSDDEDCLTLNVFRPAAPSAKPRAVLVYAHGGGATNGAGADHDGSALASQGDIVVVTVNYRLGALGFMTHPAIAAQAADGQAGNYGVMDVEAALRWVARNIRAFGGDPAKVTIAGESAGGTVICPLLAAPSAKGLFRAAILSSDDCLHDVDTWQQARARAQALSQRLDCREPADVAACLRGRTPRQIVDAGGFAAPHIGGPGGPDAYTFDRIARGDWTPVPVMIGSTREEGRIAGPGFLSFDAAAYATWLRRLVPDAMAVRIAATYPAEAPGKPTAYAISAVLTDSGMRGYGGCANLALARAMARQAPVWLYQFEDPAPPFDRRADGFDFAAAHSSELTSLWPGGAFAERTARLTPAQRDLSRQMIAFWAAFVRDGDPGAAWPRLGDDYMALRPDGSKARAASAFEADHHCALWTSAPWIMDRGEAR